MKIHTNIEHLKDYKIYLKVEEAVNEFLQKKGYLKIDLPVLSPALIPESYIEVFETHFNYLNNRSRLYLTPSPELFLKRLLAYGIGNCYYLGKSFRNGETTSSLHSPEFMMLEFYKTKVNYMDLADDVLEMLQYITNKIKDSAFAKASSDKQNSKIKFNKWEKISVIDAFQKYSRISEKELFNHKLFFKKAEKKGYQTTGFSFEDIFSQIYAQEVEPHLGQNGFPTLIYDYPKEFAALAKTSKDGKTSERFEFYVHGIEIGDCYTELTDWQEQEKRFIIENKRRKKDKKINHLIDKGFIQALKLGLVNCAGIAIGLERLTMIFANVDSIDKLKLINIV